MRKRWMAMLLCLIVLVSFSACSNNSTSDTQGSRIKVSVTFDAMKEFVEAVGKDKVEVSTIIPAGTEPHDFEPKAQDLADLSKAAIFVYNGLGMESWAEEAIQASGNDKLIVVEASAGADVIATETESEEDAEDTENEEEHDHGKYDPHLWLSLKGAQTEVNNIKDALIQADSSNKDYYERNCSDYISQLESLYNEYSDKFQSLERKTFVTGHAAFGYLCRDFGLEQNSVSDIYAEGEPSAQQLAELVEYCKENSVTTVFAEEMASPAVSQTLADEVGAKVETIYTMEGAEDDKTYLERMEENLSKIYDSLAQ